MVAYLSREWIDAVATRVAQHADRLAGAAHGVAIGITTIVERHGAGGDGDVIYHLQVDGGGVHFGSGPADPQDIVLRLQRATAAAVATGALSAKEAFVRGEIVLRGDAELLQSAQPLLVELDGVLADQHAATSYAREH